MAQAAAKTDAFGVERGGHPTLSGDTRLRLGRALRTIYEEGCDTQPIPDAQVDLLLRLRHKERERRRAG